MTAKISLVAAFLLMIALPLPTACAASRAATNPAPIFRQARELPPGMLVAQQPAEAAAEDGSDSDNNNSDSNDNDDDNQNADSNQTDQQNSAGNDQPAPPQVLNGNETDPDSAPQPQPVNPYQ